MVKTRACARRCHCGRSLSIKLYLIEHHNDDKRPHTRPSYSTRSHELARGTRMMLHGNATHRERWTGCSTKIVFACRENAANGVGCAIVNCDPAQYNPAAIAAFDLGIGVIRDRAKCENERAGVIHTSTHDIQYMVTARGRGFSGHEVLAGASEHVQIAEIAIARCFNAFNAGYGNPIGP